MKAIRHTSFGGPEVLETVEVPRPTPRPEQVLIRMGATSVNPVDWKMRSGSSPVAGDPPFPVGFDVSGTIVEVGDAVVEFRPGDNVFGMVPSRTGTHSEYVLARTEGLALRPTGLDDVHAAALATAGLTAWQGLKLSGLRPGERILIHGAAGGVGHLAIQFAKVRGAHVTGTARTANHDFLRALGADDLIDYTAVDFAAVVSAVDVVLDMVGGEYGERSLSVLRPGGRYIATRDCDARSDPRHQRVNGRPSSSDLAEIGKLVAAGQVQIHVDQMISLDEIVEAHRIAESGRVRGKIALTPWR
ncbi:NADP-dependent oxidoreductase [Nocardia sp. CA2R105]|uniref:NADP-dependent oxidoreductase n=1 Tax=Nocardia coffeae TaxID=2873381 RepID=UPI001CA65EA9|nr:NADP-dependent oxidoreductase [Nocardia coffeae]MBY8862288.1 NADP-dependent oxidoreductase [Nocardia coffeae]